MIIKSIELKNFRNYKDLFLIPSKGINLITGKNAQGKSNFLESIYFSAFSRSFRTLKEKELLKHGEEFAFTSINFESNREKKIEINIDKSGKKKILLNSNLIQKLSEYIGTLKIVSFVPEDISLIKGQPSDRRRFLNKEISQVYPVHITELIEYNKLLNQRNASIKKYKLDNYPLELVKIWDEQLSVLAEKITRRRMEFISIMNKKTNFVHEIITGKKERIELIYKSFLNSQNDTKYGRISGSFIEILNENLEQDLKYGYTGKGPHKDDFDVFIDGLYVKVFGSQGQKRTAALSIKLAQIEYIEENKGEKPIILLDDVSSELDIDRRRCLFDYIKNHQSFISTTDVNDYIGFDFPITEYFVENGELNKK